MAIELLQAQYNLVRGSRKVVLDYCEKMSVGHFTQGVEFFNNKSIRYLLVHIANTYRFWLEDFGMNKKISFHKEEDIADIAHARRIYEDVHKTVDVFLNHFASKIDSNITGKISSRNLAVETTPLALFTHVITHEFHHKGQIMSMGRSLGYTPPDADVIRF